MQKKSKFSLIHMVITGILSALAIVLMLIVRFSLLPGAKFLEYDMGDFPVIIASLFVGTPSGFIVLFFVSIVQSLTVSAASSCQGFLMHIFSTGIYIIVLKLFTLKKDSISRLAIGTGVATLALTAIMIPLNLIFTPMYLNTTVDAVLELMLPAIIPFNFLKGIINSIITICVYHPLKKILTKSNLFLGYKK